MQVMNFSKREQGLVGSFLVLFLVFIVISVALAVEKSKQGTPAAPASCDCCDDYYACDCGDCPACTPAPVSCKCGPVKGCECKPVKGCSCAAPKPAQPNKFDVRCCYCGRISTLELPK